MCRLDELIGNIELTCIQRDTVAALAAGVKTLGKLQAEVGGPDPPVAAHIQEPTAPLAAAASPR